MALIGPGKHTVVALLIAPVLACIPRATIGEDRIVPDAARPDRPPPGDAGHADLRILDTTRDSAAPDRTGADHSPVDASPVDTATSDGATGDGATGDRATGDLGPGDITRLDAGPDPERLRVAISFPSLGNQQIPEVGMTATEFSLMHMNALGVVVFRSSENWSFREPVDLGDDPPGLVWDVLDQRMDDLVGPVGQPSGLMFFMTVQSTGPDWRCVVPGDPCVFNDNSVFAAYVDALVDRHGDRLHKLQFGNEMLSPDFYSGTPAQYVASMNAFYAAVDGRLPVVLGGFSTGVLRRFTACHLGEVFPVYTRDGWLTTPEDFATYCAQTWVQVENQGVLDILASASYDEIDLHLYDDPENWGRLHAAIRGIVPDKPIIVTEFGGPHAGIDDNAADGAHHGELVQSYIDALLPLDIEEAYFFKLVERGDVSPHTYSGLISAYPELAVKPSYGVVQSFNQQ